MHRRSEVSARARASRLFDPTYFNIGSVRIGAGWRWSGSRGSRGSPTGTLANAKGWDAAPIERHAPPSCTHPGPLLFRLCCVDSPFPWYKRPPRVTILPPLSQPHAAVPWAICRRLQELQYGDQCAQRVSHAGTLNSDPPFFIALPSCGWLLVPVPIRSKKRAALPALTRIVACGGRAAAGGLHCRTSRCARMRLTTSVSR